ncbi:hypothetical protein K432DRAFT_470906 [Lepidopterella palustris CBS 459.81]|uniref:Uncharacterized protein n=1 Tax=Lepidopterella palustris CBS 459.81 TaxID=1314670 RepID=A0A8E2J9V8_9PEZI|nr:hypothetical protein K432DRAFT_470906 [Lepidopterella palustris CBS 459.81]
MASSNPSSSNNEDFQFSSVFNVKNKVALVTSALSRFGLMALQTLAVNEKLQRVVEMYGKDIAEQIIPILGDISKKDDIKRLVKEIESKEKCLTLPRVLKAMMQMNSARPLCAENSTFNDGTDTYRTNHQHGYSGTVLNIISNSGLVHVVIHLTMLLTTEIAEAGLKIRVNRKFEQIPVSRPGDDRDMADVVLFTVTNQYLNGQTVQVDGGNLIHERR